MIGRTQTFWLTGLDARRVEVEAEIHKGLPAFRVVGLADRAVQEARDRVRSGLCSSQYAFPGKRLTVNLAPAQEHKEGAGFDLAIALAVLAASGQLPPDRVAGVAAAAEMGLDGSLRPVRGAMAMAEAAARMDVAALLLAPESAAEAAAVEGVRVLPARTLSEAADLLWGAIDPQPVPPPVQLPAAPQPDLADVRGQPRARRALEIAAAGRHNLILIGPPGSGKSMLAQRLVGILPPLSRAEALEVTRVHSVAGLLPPGMLAGERPFRAPHHSASAAALIGGASLRPGEVALAHRGVLFMDELAEFPRPALESLRVPLQERRVELSRSAGRVVMPSDCIVVAAMNPCPCGHLGDPERECTCAPQRLNAYRSRLSGPLLDRFDLRVQAPRAESHGAAGEASAVVAARVAEAAERMAGGKLELSPDAARLMDDAVRRQLLSGRGATRTAAVAQSISALAAAGRVESDHLAEALSYRQPL